MEQITNERTLFSWIHMSDIHFLHGTKKSQLDQEMVLKAIVRDVSAISGSASLQIPQPDVIFVTGDIAFSGAEKDADEYIVAEKLLQAIAESAGLSNENIFTVPGNHDVQRNRFLGDDDASLLIENLRDGRRELEWALSKRKHRERLRSRFENYSRLASNFARTCIKDGETPDLYWHYSLPLTPLLTVTLLGVNTAILSHDDEDRRKLQVSLEQLKSFPDLEDASNVLAIALGHHPFSWLGDGKDVEGWLRKKAHIYLCGHAHDARSLSYVSEGGPGILLVQAGATHNRSGSPNSYNYGAVIKKPLGQISARIWTRIWSEKNKDFREDPESCLPGKQYAEHNLPIELAEHDSMRSVKVGGESRGIRIPVRMSKKQTEYITDFPPVVDLWVGRKAELEALERTNSGVVAITGIGGQGKSALASKYLENWKALNPAGFWDWRDCREQREQFHNKLVSIIEHYTLGRITARSLEGAKAHELVNLFFENVKDEGGLIVLDNVDHYVDVSAMTFTLGVADFVKAALKYGHNFRFLLTCRPRINYPSPRFQEIRLEGISVEEAQELFELRGAQCEEGDISTVTKRVHALTDGHPLWLNLIATQVASAYMLKFPILSFS